MKILRLLITLTLFGILLSTTINAQIINPNEVIKRQGKNRANDKIEQGVDTGYNKLEKGIGSLFGKKEGKKESTSQNEAKNSNSIEGKDPDALFSQYGMYPPDGATDVPIPVTFKWKPMNSSDFTANRYEVYIYTEGYADDMLIGNTSETKKTYSNLEPNTTYTWKYVGQNSDGKYVPGGGGSFTTGNGTTGADPVITPQMNVQWNKFDFVPGDEVIFEDSPSTSEENGEFPSHWDLETGQVEIAQVNGKTVIMFLDGGKIMPYLKNSSEDYLPDVFTIEFDFYTPSGGNRLFFYLTDTKHQRSSEPQEFEVTPIRVDTPDGNYVEHPEKDYTYCENGCWTHVSVAFTKGKLKVYLDDIRLINIPHYAFNPSGFTIYPYFASANENKVFYVKNVRIAKGGVKYYDRVMSKGKIICNGIKFDTNKTTLKPESMGPINKIYELMQKQPDLKFSVEGHTDSNGDDTKNQTLSEQRAKAVMEQLIKMGISANRLTSKGFGESKPIADNTTAEGKANNRRVEFVKF